MKRLAAVALVIVGLTLSALTLPACAQRGAAHGGFSGGHVGGFSGGGFHSGFSAPAPSHFSGGFSGFSGARSGYPVSGSVHPAKTPHFSGGPSYRTPYNRSGFGANRTPYGGRDGRGRRVHISRNGSWFSYIVPAYIGSWYGYGDGYGYGYPDTGYSDDSDAAAPAQASAAQYDVQPGEDEPAREPYYPSAGSYPPGGTYQAAPASEDAVTLLFKDGRPSEQIHNYALTRTTLFVLDDHRRDIPVEEIDLEATAKVNREAGIEFQLPAGQ